MAEMVEEPTAVAERNPVGLNHISLPSELIKGSVRIQVTSFRQVRPVIYDAEGKRVKVLDRVAGNGSPEEVMLDVSGLANGVYWIDIAPSRGQTAQRFVLIR
jgi:hypothetical protein